MDYDMFISNSIVIKWYDKLDFVLGWLYVNFEAHIALTKYLNDEDTATTYIFECLYWVE